MERDPSRSFALPQIGLDHEPGAERPRSGEGVLEAPELGRGGSRGSSGRGEPALEPYAVAARQGGEARIYPRGRDQ